MHAVNFKMLIYFFLLPLIIETSNVPSIPCKKTILSICKLENVNRSFSICYCTNQTLCPCYLGNLDFLRQQKSLFQNNSSLDRFGTQNYGGKSSIPLHLIFSCMIIFILILIVFIGMISTCFCSTKSRCCFKRTCPEIANLDSQSSSPSYSTNYTENEPPPMYSQEMLKDSQKSEKLPDYKSLFAIEFQQQQQQSDQF